MVLLAGADASGFVAYGVVRAGFWGRSRWWWTRPRLAPFLEGQGGGSISARSQAAGTRDARDKREDKKMRWDCGSFAFCLPKPRRKFWGRYLFNANLEPRRVHSQSAGSRIAPHPRCKAGQEVAEHDLVAAGQVMSRPFESARPLARSPRLFFAPPA